MFRGMIGIQSCPKANGESEANAVVSSKKMSGTDGIDLVMTPRFMAFRWMVHIDGQKGTFEIREVHSQSAWHVLTQSVCCDSCGEYDVASI